MNSVIYKIHSNGPKGGLNHKVFENTLKLNNDKCINVKSLYQCQYIK